MAEGRMMRCKFNGREFDIPEFWWIGFSQSHPEMSPRDIIEWWAYQDELESEYQAQRATESA